MVIVILIMIWITLPVSTGSIMAALSEAIMILFILTLMVITVFHHGTLLDSQWDLGLAGEIHFSVIPGTDRFMVGE